MKLIRRILAVFGLLKKTNYQLWKESIREEEAIMDKMIAAKSPSDADALLHKLRRQQAITLDLAKKAGIRRETNE